MSKLPENLPPGYRFSPKDKELIELFLKPKITGKYEEDGPIPEIGFYQHEPWDLPGNLLVLIITHPCSFLWKVKYFVMKSRKMLSFCFVNCFWNYVVVFCSFCVLVIVNWSITLIDQYKCFYLNLYSSPKCVCLWGFVFWSCCCLVHVRVSFRLVLLFSWGMLLCSWVLCNWFSSLIHLLTKKIKSWLNLLVFLCLIVTRKLLSFCVIFLLNENIRFSTDWSIVWFIRV